MRWEGQTGRLGEEPWLLALHRRALFFVIYFNDVRRRLLSIAPPYALNKGQAFFAQNALYAANGIALAIKQVPHTAQEVDIFGAVITSATAALERPYLRKAAFPEPQHVLRDVDLFGNLADGAKRVRGFVQLRPLRQLCADFRALVAAIRFGVDGAASVLRTA